MAYAAWKLGHANLQVVFNLLFRRNPFGNGYAVFAGLHRIIECIDSYRFSQEDIKHLQSREEDYDPEFLTALRGLRFRGDIEAMREGEVVFPHQPIVKVKATFMEAILLEAALLNIVNGQTPVATRASRIRHAASNATLIDMATRRHMEVDAALWGARAAYIGGFDATSNTEAERVFGVPSKGTMAHAWVQLFAPEQVRAIVECHASELEAFRTFASVFPHMTVLLVDTYDTLASGVPNAITVGKELEAKGLRLAGIRLDSGDLATLSIHARRMLDEAGLGYVKIFATSDLDEDAIANLNSRGARIDVWGVGTKLAATGGSLGGVYKLVAKANANGVMIPVNKFSESVEKTTIPGDVSAYRIIDPSTGTAIADYLALADEPPPQEAELMRIGGKYHAAGQPVGVATPLWVPIYEAGRRVYETPSTQNVRKYHEQQIGIIPDACKQRLNPETYPVALSPKLAALRAQYGNLRQPCDGQGDLGR